MTYNTMSRMKNNLKLSLGEAVMVSGPFAVFEMPSGKRVVACYYYNGSFIQPCIVGNYATSGIALDPSHFVGFGYKYSDYGGQSEEINMVRLWQTSTSDPSKLGYYIHAMPPVSRPQLASVNGLDAAIDENYSVMFGVYTSTEPWEQKVLVEPRDINSFTTNSFELAGYRAPWPYEYDIRYYKDYFVPTADDLSYTVYQPRLGTSSVSAGGMPFYAPHLKPKTPWLASLNYIDPSGSVQFGSQALRKMNGNWSTLGDKVAGLTAGMQFTTNNPDNPGPFTITSVSGSYIYVEEPVVTTGDVTITLTMVSDISYFSHIPAAYYYSWLQGAGYIRDSVQYKASSVLSHYDWITVQFDQAAKLIRSYGANNSSIQSVTDLGVCSDSTIVGTPSRYDYVTIIVDGKIYAAPFDKASLYSTIEWQLLYSPS